MKTIGTEEHFVTEEVVTAWSRLDSRARDDSRASAPPGEMGERLREVGERRIAAMDEAGLDVQVISLTSPGLHNLPANEATRLQVETNDRIAELVNADPDRFQGLRHPRYPRARRSRARARAGGHQDKGERYISAGERLSGPEPAFSADSGAARFPQDARPHIRVGSVDGGVRRRRTTPGRSCRGSPP
jgi:hypothetical protein